MSTLPQDETEFGGVPGQPLPAEKGYTPKQWEELARMHRTDPMDPEAGADIVSERVV